MKQEFVSKTSDQVLSHIYLSYLSLHSSSLRLPLLTINWLKQHLLSLIKKFKSKFLLFQKRGC